jgi:hypothetical protein
MRVLTAAGPVRVKRLTQWTMFGCNEAAISAREFAIFERVWRRHRCF